MCENPVIIYRINGEENKLNNLIKLEKEIKEKKKILQKKIEKKTDKYLNIKIGDISKK